MSRFVDVVFLAEDAVKLIKATVADIGRLIELAVNLLLEVRANLIAQVAGGASAGTLGVVLAEIMPVAIRPP